MESVATSLSLAKDLDRQVRHIARRRGMTKNGLIQEALREYLSGLETAEIERKLQAKARIMGISTEDDVAKLVREVRARGRA